MPILRSKTETLEGPQLIMSLKCRHYSKTWLSLLLKSFGWTYFGSIQATRDKVMKMSYSIKKKLSEVKQRWTPQFFDKSSNHNFTIEFLTDQRGDGNNFKPILQKQTFFSKLQVKIVEPKLLYYFKETNGILLLVWIWKILHRVHSA